MRQHSETKAEVRSPWQACVRTPAATGSVHAMPPFLAEVRWLALCGGGLGTRSLPLRPPANAKKALEWCKYMQVVLTDALPYQRVKVQCIEQQCFTRAGTHLRDAAGYCGSIQLFT